MKKKILVALLALSAVFACILGLSACDSNDDSTTEEHTHSYGKWETTIEATCTEDGLQTRTCECGDKQTQKVTAPGHHTYGDWETAIEATCITDGLQTRTCECGDKQTQKINKLFNHNVVDGVCTVCGGSTDGTKGLNFTLYDGRSYRVTGIGTATDTDIVIPAIYNNKSVTSINSSAFYNSSKFTSLTIPDSVTEIDSSSLNRNSGITKIYYTGDIASWCAISGLGRLMSNNRTLYISGKQLTGELVIPDEITSISSSAFEGCNELTSVTIGNSVTEIGNSAFEDCSGLTSVTIGNSVSSIGSYAFKNCSRLTSITIPDSVTSIGSYAFKGCSEPTSITVNNNNPTYYSENNCLLTKDGKTLILGCKNSIIPDSVSSIGSYAFYGCSGLTSITIPDSVSSIGTAAFYGCSGLTSITIGNSVSSIDSYAFEDCSSLTSITIPDSVTSIGRDAFWGTAYYNDDSNWEDNVLYIGKHLIEAKSKIADSYIIKQGTLIIGEKAFYGCSGLTSITIPNSVSSIGTAAFSGCSGLISVTIHDSVIEIGTAAFYGCSGLTSITIPDSVTSIGRDAFGGTAYYNDDSNWENNVLYIGKHLIKAKSDIADSYNIRQGTLAISNNAFWNCNKLISITIPDSVTFIGESAFYGCSGLTSITIPDSVSSIGKSAFLGCSRLTSITVDINNKKYYSENNCLLTKDGKTLILGCKNSIIPEGVTSIGDSAFRGCSELTSITIPDSVSSIGTAAFYGCIELKDINFNGTKAQWNKISKGSYWDFNTSKYTVHCTDGDIAKFS